MTVYGKDVVTDETITCDIDFTEEATGLVFLLSPAERDRKKVIKIFQT